MAPGLSSGVVSVCHVGVLMVPRTKVLNVKVQCFIMLLGTFYKCFLRVEINKYSQLL